MDVVELEHRHLRSALEFAIAIVVEGAKRRPPLKYPAGLKKYLRMQRLPAAALGPVRRIIEADDEFRTRLGAGAVPELVDPIGMLWLQRPTGWEDDVRRLIAEQAAEQEEADLAAAVRREQKRREAAEHVAARTRADLVTARERLEALGDELDELRAAVTKLDDENAELRAELVDARNEVRHANDRTAAALGRVEQVESERDAALAELRESVVVRDEVLADRATIAGEVAALSEAAAAASDLAAQLAALASPGLGSDGSAARGARGRAERRAIAMPGGVLGDSDAATEFLLRSGASVLVDGYNVAMAGWPSLPLERQRGALLDAVENVAKRYGSDITVVFDGADVVGASAEQRRIVRVVYSPDGVIADDVIRSEVSRLPVSRHVVVVTDDAEIVGDVRQQGANTVATPRFLAVARR